MKNSENKGILNVINNFAENGDYMKRFKKLNILTELRLLSLHHMIFPAITIAICFILLNLIDFDKLEDILLNIDSTTIHQLTTDLAALSGTVSTVSQHVEAVEADLNTQKTRIDSLESLPRIYYQSEEPEGAIPNGTFWIVGE